MDRGLMKVGKLAKATGLTVRTLHYYEEIGLLAPAQRSEKGYRLYGRAQIQRLQQIVSLQQLGFKLEEIRAMLDDAGYTLPRVLALHTAQLQQQIQQQQQLLDRLQSILQSLDGSHELTDETLLETIKVTTMHEKYYTAEQLETLKKRGEAMGPEAMQKAQDDWTELNNAFRSAMEKGTDPGTPEVQALVVRMNEMILAFTGGDPGIARSLGNMYKEEGAEKASRGAIDQALGEYMGKARAIAEGS